MEDPKSSKILFVANLTLEEWLHLFREPPDDKRFPDYSFQTKDHRDQYISTIKSRSDEDVKLLLEHFLIQSGSLGVSTSQI